LFKKIKKKKRERKKWNFIRMSSNRG